MYTSVFISRGDADRTLFAMRGMRKLEVLEYMAGQQADPVSDPVSSPAVRHAAG